MTDKDNEIKFVDNVLKKLCSPDRLKYYQKVKRTYGEQRASRTSPGFEATIAALLYSDLRYEYGDNVYLEWPVIGGGHIDLKLERDERSYYFEIKMYKSLSAEDYKKDTKKLIDEVDDDDNAVGIHVQLNAYYNSKTPARIFMEETEAELFLEQDFWQDSRVLGDEYDIHIVRLMFAQAGKGAAKNHC